MIIEYSRLICCGDMSANAVRALHFLFIYFVPSRLAWLTLSFAPAI
jgi:hypothetical protein